MLDVTVFAKSDQIYGLDKCLVDPLASRHSYLPQELIDVHTNYLDSINVTEIAENFTEVCKLKHVRKQSWKRKTHKKNYALRQLVTDRMRGKLAGRLLARALIG